MSESFPWVRESFPWVRSHFTLAEVRIIEKWREAHADHVISASQNQHRFRLRDRHIGEIRAYLLRNPRKPREAA